MSDHEKQGTGHEPHAAGHELQGRASKPEDAPNPGLPVHGYKAQPQTAVDTVNGFKADEERLLRKLDALQETRYPGGERVADINWLYEGRLQLQQAFMLINRAVFQPGRVALPEDTTEG